MIVDITSDQDVARLETTVRTELQKRGATLLGLVNNAGIGNYGFAEALALKRFQDVLDVNCLGTVRVTKAFIDMLRAHGSGARLITIGSLSDRLPAGFGSAYVPSKAYVCSFTECVGAELRRFGVRTAVIEPGFIATELLDAGQESGAKACATADADVCKAYGDFAPMMANVRKPVMFCESLNGGRTGGGAKVAEATMDALSSSWPRSRYLVGWEASLLGQLPRIPGWTRLLSIGFERQHRAVHP
jgi:NAD(P)-dependent dehydrogenase (short-subunit alcohol dehydrogenase family)